MVRCLDSRFDHFPEGFDGHEALLQGTTVECVHGPAEDVVEVLGDVGGDSAHCMRLGLFGLIGVMFLECDGGGFFESGAGFTVHVLQFGVVDALDFRHLGVLEDYLVVHGW